MAPSRGSKIPILWVLITDQVLMVILHNFQGQECQRARVLVKSRNLHQNQSLNLTKLTRNQDHNQMRGNQPKVSRPS